MSSDVPEEYRQLLRDRHPKRSVMHKVHRWRHTNEDDDWIAKVVISENVPKGKTLDDGISEKVLSKLDCDWTDLRCGVLYSLGKKKRWTLPEELKENVPECEDYEYKLPIPLGSISLAESRPNWTHACGLSFWFYRPTMGYSVLSGGQVDVEVKKKDGSKKKAKCNSATSVNHELRSDENTEKKPQVHLQFQTLKYGKNPKIHNSRVFDYHSCSSHARVYPTPEGLQLDKDIPRTGYLEAHEDDYGMDNMNAKEEDGPVRSTLTLGDFMDTDNIQKDNKGKGKKNLKDWVVV